MVCVDASFAGYGFVNRRDLVEFSAPFLLCVQVLFIVIGSGFRVC